MLTFFAILALLSILLSLWQWVATWSFPLHRRVSAGGFTPGVTVLKPLKGLDDNVIGCLRSWFTQDYAGAMQTILGVASPDDPACDAVRQLIKEFSNCDAQLLVCPESLGVNGKVSSLIQMQRQAKHNITVVSDADVLVPRDFLANVVAPLREPAVGLVNCFYRLANPVNVGMRWEAVAINADFWSQVLQGRSLQPLDFALGAVMATRRAELEKIGGFESLADYLADDFQLGNRVVRIAGKRIELCPVVVDCRHGPMTWGEVWAHQLRWARTVRVCKPLPYFASVLSNATLWPLLWVLLQPGKWSLATLAMALFIRVVAAFALQKRLGFVPGQAAYWWLPPLKDLFQFALWIGAFAGQHIVWRGQRLRLQPDGRLVPVSNPAPK